MMETYSHLSPRGRIYNIERDIEKEHKELIAKFKASALHAQSSLAHSGWEYKELSLCCSNKERSVISSGGMRSDCQQQRSPGRQHNMKANVFSKRQRRRALPRLAWQKGSKMMARLRVGW